MLLRFPARAPPVEISYTVSSVEQQELLRCIEQLELAPWTAHGRSATALLLRLVLLKRLESGHAAFRASIERLLRTLRAFGDALASGHLLTPAEQRIRAAGDADQLAFDALVLEPLPRALDAVALRSSAEADCERLERARRLLSAVDPKLLRLRDLLHKELGGRPVLVFTEFRDTARAIWRELYDTIPAALIHGGGAWLGRTPVPRRVVVERFAPLSNAAAAPPQRERPLVLVATDVLAEGLNLQDAADLISYDLPWNPVRLLQRMGRIDRLGSPHPVVRGYYFSPDAELETMLRLMRRLRTKIAAIRGSVGEDGAVLAGGRRTGKPGGAGRLVPADRLFEVEERLRRALTQAEAAADPLAGLPLADLPLAGHSLTEPSLARDLLTGHSRPDSGGRPVGVLDLPGAALPRGAGAILFFEYHDRQRVVLLGSRPFEDPAATAALLEIALSARDHVAWVAAAAARPLVMRARAYLVPPPPPARGHPVARLLRQKLLRLLGRRPGGPTAAECRRVDDLTTALRQPLSVGQELRLRRIRSDASFDEVVAAAAAALEHGRSMSGPEGSEASTADAEPRFLGGFRVLPG